MIREVRLGICNRVAVSRIRSAGAVYNVVLLGVDVPTRCVGIIASICRV